MFFYKIVGFTVATSSKTRGSLFWCMHGEVNWSSSETETTLKNGRNFFGTNTSSYWGWSLWRKRKGQCVQALFQQMLDRNGWHCTWKLEQSCSEITLRWKTGLQILVRGGWCERVKPAVFDMSMKCHFKFCLNWTRHYEWKNATIQSSIWIHNLAIEWAKWPRYAW